MANPKRGEVTFDIDGTAYTLRYTTNSFVELEDALGEPVNRILGDISDPATFRLKVLRAVIWAGLLDSHPDMTPKRAGDIITNVGLETMMTKVSQAIDLAFPKESSETRPQ